MYSSNETVIDSPVVRGPVAAATCDRTADLARIIRHALKAGANASPLDRAIRSAVGSSSEAGGDMEFRTGLLVRRLNARLAEREVAHRETVRG
jgi:hypothetical protein